MRNKKYEYEQKYSKTEIFRDKNLKLSSKRTAGLIGFIFFIILTSIVFFYALKSVIADPDTILRLLEMVAFLTAGLLGVGVVEGFAKKINKKYKRRVDDDDDDYYDEVRRNKR